MNLIERVRPAVVAAFPDIERARRAPKIEWGHGFTGWSGAAYGDMDHQRELCWSLMMLALYEHQRGDDSAALARVDDMLFLSRSSEAIDAQVTGHLNASAMGASAAGALLKIAPDLNLRDVTDRKHASGLIEQLLDDSESVDHTARSLLVSRATALSVAGMFGPALPEPLVRSEVARTFEKQRLLAAAARQTDWSRASAMIGPPPRRAGSQLAYMSRLFSQFYWGREDQVVLNCFRWKTDRRAAAIALAIALYRSDHNGAWPDSLQQLVPNYLPAVPLDPMAPDGARFRFIGLRATTQPIIYAVGQDGSDDGGSTRPSRASWDPVDPWTTRDTVYHLTRQPRQIDDSDAAQDHPGDQHDGGGKSK
jgi:hypothetical protein